MQNETPKKRKGRPTDYTEELINEICKRISNGNSVNRLSKQKDMPHKATIYLWLGKYSYFIDKYEKALKEREDYHFDELLDIADEVEADRTEIQKARLRIDTRKWVLSRMNPRKYGDKADGADESQEVATPVAVTIEVKDGRKPES